MGKRSRKRDIHARDDDAPVVAAPPRKPPPSRRARLEEMPPAPWAPLPLVEICIFIGLVLMLVGFFAGGDRRAALVLCGVAMAALAGLEQSAREHFTGFRSHSSLLAGFFAVLTLIATTALSVERIATLVAAVLVGAVAFWLLRRGFARRSGGLSFRA